MQSNEVKEYLIDDSCKDFVLQLLDKIKAFSQETYIHSINVADIAVILGEKLKLSKKDLIKLYTAGLVHDVGKITLDINLLEKPKCTKEEVEKIRFGHIEGTKQILQGQIDNDIFDIAYHHHERLNGKGYPQGLEGSQLSYLDRILQVADVTSALLMKRSYKNQMDSKMVDAILDKLIKNGELDEIVVKLDEKVIIDVDKPNNNVNEEISTL